MRFELKVRSNDLWKLMESVLSSVDSHYWESWRWRRCWFLLRCPFGANLLFFRGALTSQMTSMESLSQLARQRPMRECIEQVRKTPETNINFIRLFCIFYFNLFCDYIVCLRVTLLLLLHYVRPIILVWVRLNRKKIKPNRNNFNDCYYHYVLSIERCITRWWQFRWLFYCCVSFFCAKGVEALSRSSPSLTPRTAGRNSKKKALAWKFTLASCHT